ncbi:hypothetical protein AVEN_65740-1, partial [Araneus ventricosus]
TLAEQRWARSLQKTSSSITSEEGGQDNSDVNYRRAKDILLFIPESLRERVLIAHRDPQCSVKWWRWEHPDILRFKDEECCFHWRPDGSIDTIRNVHHTVLGEDIGISDKSEIACKYSLVDRITTSWVGMLL